MLQLAYLLAVAWLPGAVLYRLPLLDRERRAALDPAERVFWAIVLSLVTSLSVVLILAAAHRYSFQRLLLTNAALSGVALAIWRQRLRWQPPRRFTAATLIPIVLALFCALRFAHPSEYVMGGKDPGVYVNEGIQIAQRGALVVHDRVIAELPNFARRDA